MVVLSNLLPPSLITSIDALRQLRQQWQQEGLSVALVPTMGNLHQGHLALVEQAQRHADRVIVSIFVNPRQFGQHEDFDRYPRTLANDQVALTTVGADAIFAPDVHDIYPDQVTKADEVTQNFSIVPPARLTDTLCGMKRPGHFAGVATIVLKLFNLVQPQLAVFGQKDYQQLTILRTMVADLNLPITLLAAPTARASDGLALSSRNQYLTDAQRSLAPMLYWVMNQISEQLHLNHSPQALIAHYTQHLLDHGFDQVEYIAIRDPITLAELEKVDSVSYVILVAAHLGNTRLIDNLVVEASRLA